MFAIAMMGPIWRIACAVSSTIAWPLIVMPFASFDCLAVGSLLALYTARNSRAVAAARRFHLVCRFGGIALMVAWAFCMSAGPAPLASMFRFEAIFGNSAMALFFAWVVRRAASGQGGDIGVLLQMNWLRYVGKISYGIYICHLFMPPIANYLLAQIQGFTISPLWAHLALSVGVASLSWLVFESKINGLEEVPGIHSEPQTSPPSPSATNRLAALATRPLFRRP